MNQPQMERPLCYYVPRRFNLRALMVLTTVIAAVCALLQRFNTPPRVYIVIAVMSGIAAAAQVFFPKNPRLASSVAGGIIHCIAALYLFANPFLVNGFEPDVIFIFFYTGILFVIWGLFLGYAFGTLTAGIFMLADWFSPTSMFNHDQNPQPPEKQPR